MGPKLLKHLRTFALYLVGTVFAIWLGALAQDLHWLDHPRAQVQALMNVLAAVAHSEAFHWAGGVAIGFALGVWLDTMLRRKEAVLPSAPPEKTLQQRAEENRARLQTSPPPLPLRDLPKLPPTAKEKLGSWTITDKFSVAEASFLWAGYLAVYGGGNSITLIAEDHDGLGLGHNRPNTPGPPRKSLEACYLIPRCPGRPLYRRGQRSSKPAQFFNGRAGRALAALGSPVALAGFDPLKRYSVGV
ncbi:MAG: hypothetical protein H0U98_09490 [Alphaproteobacteria bacterium]|nr:hypothetical protein [Alphaproteobacteria bacterium]